MNTIVRLCPSDKLVGCQYEGNGKKVRDPNEIYDELSLVAEGIFLNIDNNLLTECQKAADEAMIRVCGSTENCDDLVIDEKAGTRAFKYQVCQYNGFGSSGNQMPNWTGQCFDSLDAVSEAALKQDGDKGWAGKLSGLVYWGEISYDSDENQFTTYDQYIAAIEEESGPMDKEQKEVIQERVFGTEIKSLTAAVETAIKAIESDAKVQFCITGRNFQGMRDKSGDIKKLGARTDDKGKIKDGEARFPNLTQQMRQIIAASALKNARDNYMKKYDTEIERMMKDQVTAAKRLDATAARETAKQTCVDWAKSSQLPVSKAPKASNAGRWIAVGLIAAVAIVATVFTFGGSAVAGTAAITALTLETVSTGTAIAAGAVIATAVGGMAAAATMAAKTEPVGKANVDQWNFKQSITTLFNEQTGVCTKETISQNCSKVKKNYCKEWSDPVTKESSINLLGGDTK